MRTRQQKGGCSIGRKGESPKGGCKVGKKAPRAAGTFVDADLIARRKRSAIAKKGAATRKANKKKAKPKPKVPVKKVSARSRLSNKAYSQFYPADPDNRFGLTATKADGTKVILRMKNKGVNLFGAHLK